MSAHIAHGNRNIILEIRQERLETEIALYASSLQHRDISEERRLRNLLVEFLDDAHSERFSKSRYMRHVGNIIGSAIRDELLVPWDLVDAKRTLRGTKSTLSDEDAFSLEERFLIPHSRPRHSLEDTKGKGKEIPKGILRSHPPDTLPSRAETTEDCPRCQDIGIRCKWIPNQAACVPCHIKHRPCASVPLRRAQNRAAQNSNLVLGAHGPCTSNERENPADTREKDRITTALSELRRQFELQRDLDNERWNRILPELESLRAMVLPHQTGTLEPVTPPIIPRNVRKRSASNENVGGDPKRLRFATLSPDFQKA